MDLFQVTSSSVFPGTPYALTPAEGDLILSLLSTEKGTDQYTLCRTVVV